MIKIAQIISTPDIRPIGTLTEYAVVEEDIIGLAVVENTYAHENTLMWITRDKDNFIRLRGDYYKGMAL